MIRQSSVDQQHPQSESSDLSSEVEASSSSASTVITIYQSPQYESASDLVDGSSASSLSGGNTNGHVTIAPVTVHCEVICPPTVRIATHSESTSTSSSCQLEDPGPLVPCNSSDCAPDEILNGPSLATEFSSCATTPSTYQPPSVIEVSRRKSSADQTATSASPYSSASYRSPPPECSSNMNANSHESASIITSDSTASWHQQAYLERIETLENQLERIKLERDAWKMENERLSFQLQMMTDAVKQHRHCESLLKCPIENAHSGTCSCLSTSVPVGHLASSSNCQCACSSCAEATTSQQHLLASHPNVPLTNGGQDLSFTCSHGSTEAIHGSRGVSSFSSFKTTVDNLEDFGGSPHQHGAHFLLHHSEQNLITSSPLGSCLNPHCSHLVSAHGTLTPPSSLVSNGPRHKLLRASAIADAYAANGQSPTTPTLSPSLSKHSLALSASLNLSPTSVVSSGSPLYGYPQQNHSHALTHAASSNLIRTVRTSGGSSTSLTSAPNGAPYGYELSQQLLDKQMSALERKYGGREAREAAITIQRAFRSYRLQKRFQTLTIQAICHQQLKHQKEEQQKQQEKQKSHHQQQTKEETLFPRVVVPPKLAEIPKMDSLSMAPIDREAMQHRFSRKMSANYALDDLVRMQSMQQHQQTIQSNSPGPSVHHQNQFLTIPRQASPPVTLVTSYEPVYNPPMSSLLYDSNHSLNQNHQHQHHPQQQQVHQVHIQHHRHSVIDMTGLEIPLHKKTSFSSTSSTGSSSSLHASSTSSKPSDIASLGNSRPTGKEQLTIHENRLHATSSTTRSQPQLLNKQRMQKNSQQQQQHLQTQTATLPSTANGAAGAGSGLSTIHKTTSMSSHHLMATGNGANGTAGNTVSFSPNVDFLANNTEAVSSSVDAYRKRQYRVGLNLFNKNPSERGIRFLINNGYIEQSDNTDAQANFVAHFLLTRKGLSRQMIGEYISEPASFNKSVLKAFCSGVTLSGIIVDEALRAFQVHFRFPGEAQKIERLVEAFADRYKECNPSDVLSRDSIFILAFAIIMLNTDLHKPTNVKHRMTPEQWLANLKGVFSEGDLSSQFLLGIYKRIKKQELQTGGDHVTQVLKVQSTIIGKDVPNLCVSHRRLVCYCRLYEIRDLNRREKVGQHQRDVFLFNDLLLITKTTSRSRNGQLAEYQYRTSQPLDGLQVLVFSTPYYPNGIRISRRVDNKMVACFNARNDLDQQRFVDDLQEAINEMDDMEQLRITKSSSLVHLNTLASNGGPGEGGSGGHGPSVGAQSSSTVITSPSELDSYTGSSLNSSTVNFASNGCANQSRHNPQLGSAYQYSAK